MWTNILRWVAINTSLAAIPVACAYAMYRLAARSPGKGRASVKAVVILLGFAWLAFLPNTCYLLTEWRHFLDIVGYTGLHARWQADCWSALRLMMYTLFYLCYSGIGILAFNLAIRPVAQMARQAGLTLWVWGMLLFVLNSIGVYLGLVLRLNSWDIIARPAQVWEAVVRLADRPALASLVLVFAGFLWLAYLAVDIWVDGFICRRRNGNR